MKSSSSCLEAAVNFFIFIYRVEYIWNKEKFQNESNLRDKEKVKISSACEATAANFYIIHFTELNIFEIAGNLKMNATWETRKR